MLLNLTTKGKSYTYTIIIGYISLKILMGDLYILVNFRYVELVDDSEDQLVLLQIAQEVSV